MSTCENGWGVTPIPARRWEPAGREGGHAAARPAPPPGRVPVERIRRTTNDEQHNGTGPRRGTSRPCGLAVVRRARGTWTWTCRSRLKQARIGRSWWDGRSDPRRPHGRGAEHRDAGERATRVMGLNPRGTRPLKLKPVVSFSYTRIPVHDDSPVITQEAKEPIDEMISSSERRAHARFLKPFTAAVIILLPFVAGTCRSLSIFRLSGPSCVCSHKARRGARRVGFLRS